jgi:hypothetical protein
MGLYVVLKLDSIQLYEALARLYVALELDSIQLYEALCGSSTELCQTL